MSKPSNAPPQAAHDAVEAAAEHHAVELPSRELPSHDVLDFAEASAAPANPGIPDDLPEHGGAPDFPQLDLPEALGDVELPSEADLAGHLPDFIFDIG